jgi:uncharacterized protein (TIGR00730 family)
MTEAKAWRELFADSPAATEATGARAELIRSLLETVGELASPEVEMLDLKIADVALAEMAEAFAVFRPYRAIPKLTMFGSARTQSHDPVYLLAKELARQVAEDGWMVVTGAGPGIMQAGIEGAGRERSFGVNIRLPFEQGANPFIALDPKLVEMRYFFTRKLILVKESAGYAVLPGGFGTLDELFELLTLLQTGKALPAPVVLVETEGGSYWHGLEAFLEEQAIERGYISPEDDVLWTVVNSAEEAVSVLRGFYRNYHSIRMVGGTMVIRLQTLPSPAELAGLNEEFSDLLERGDIHPTDPMSPEVATDDALDLARLALRFDRIHYARLHQLIDALNRCTGT